MSDARYFSGQLLLSMPGIGDPRFERAVIAMCMHDEDGALGLIINKPHPEIRLRDLMEQLEVEPGETPEDAHVYIGGPVEPQRGFVLHSLDYGGRGTIGVADRWALTSTVDVLRAIALGKGPARWLVTLGYAGWAAGQLDAEMKRHGWLVMSDKLETVFEAAPDSRWPSAYAAMGIDISHLSDTAGSA